MKITFKNAIELNVGLGSCINNGLSVQSILSIIDLKEELQKIAEKYNKALADIMKQHGVQSLSGKYSWVGNENQDKITSDIDELISTEVEITKANCLQDEEVIKLTSGLNIDSISFLLKFLKK